MILLIRYYGRMKLLKTLDWIKTCKCMIMFEVSIQDLELCIELINHLITLRSILKDTVKIKKILELEIEKLEQKEINELKVLTEEILIMIIRNKYLGKSSYDIDEEEIDLIEQAKKKTDKIEELKRDLKLLKC